MNIKHSIINVLSFTTLLSQHLEAPLAAIIAAALLSWTLQFVFVLPVCHKGVTDQVPGQQLFYKVSYITAIETCTPSELP